MRKKGENPLAKGRCVCYTKNSRKAIPRMKEVRRWTAAVVRDDGTIDVCFWQEAELWPSCHRSLPAFSEARRHCPTPMRSYIYAGRLVAQERDGGVFFLVSPLRRAQSRADALPKERRNGR